MSVDDEALKPLRERIDSIDRQLLTLINARAQCAAGQINGLILTIKSAFTRFQAGEAF